MSRNSVKGGFDPLSLFSASEPGFWYDYSDFSTLFQDSAGTTPVTATVNDFPCLAGVTQCITPSPRPSPLYVSIIALGSTGDCYFTPGSGL